MLLTIGGVFWNLSNGYNSNAYENMIFNTIFASPVLFKYVFKNFATMEKLFCCDPFKLEPVIKVLIANEDLFNHYIPDKEKLSKACTFFGKHSSELIKKFNTINREAAENKPLFII